MQRLDKIIALQLNISRSDAKSDIRKGFVTLNGERVYEPSKGVDLPNDRLGYKGQPLFYKEHVYIIMNKPMGVLSASSDKSRKTVVDLVPDRLKRKNLFPAGRLDKDTTGLIIITDDGDFAHKIISPKKNVFKTYKAELDGAVSDDMIKIFADGVVLADGTLCKPAILRPLPENSAEIKISEGRYHQIKRMFGAVGLGVNTLERRAIGGLTLPPELGYGECRELSDTEIAAIYVD